MYSNACGWWTDVWCHSCYYMRILPLLECSIDQSASETELSVLYSTQVALQMFCILHSCFLTAVGRPRDLIQNDKVTLILFVYIHNTSFVENWIRTANIFYVTACQHLWSSGVWANAKNDCFPARIFHSSSHYGGSGGKQLASYSAVGGQHHGPPGVPPHHWGNGQETGEALPHRLWSGQNQCHLGAGKVCISPLPVSSLLWQSAWFDVSSLPIKLCIWGLVDLARIQCLIY